MLRPEDLRLSRAHERWVHAAWWTLAVSGALWLALRRWVSADGPFGPERHPLEPWMMRVHGASAMAFLVVLGTLLPVHILGGWRLRRLSRSGLSLLGSIAFLILTGLGLYYSGSETLRDGMSLAHWITGLVASLVLALHAYYGHRER